MKTIANMSIIIINGQNVKSEHLLAVIITSVFKEESSLSPPGQVTQKSPTLDCQNCHWMT